MDINKVSIQAITSFSASDWAKTGLTLIKINRKYLNMNVFLEIYNKLTK
jgi:hypothetical protein